MKKFIAIIAGEPNSISSEIIFKSWMLRKKFKYKPFFIIGSIDLLNLQKKKLKYKIKIKNLDNNFKIKDLKGNKLPVYNVDYRQKKPFEKISNKSSKYILKCFEKAIQLIDAAKSSGAEIIKFQCHIVEEELELAAKNEQMELPWQYFAVIMPVKTVGVQGDVRAYGNTIAVRAVQSYDAMTAQAIEVPYSVLKKISERITRELKSEVNRVVYDITDKPPGTIEWE